MTFWRDLAAPAVLLALVATAGAVGSGSSAESPARRPALGPARLIISHSPRRPSPGYRHPPLLRDARAEVYKTVGPTELLVFIFEPPKHKPADRRPAAAFFYGGGWITYNPGQFHRQAKYLASRGMVTCIFEYRVRHRHGTTPFESVKDGRSAIRWMRANAARLGIDLHRIVASGGSAGGHVAAAAGTLPGLDEDGEDTRLSCRPDALVLFNPVFDNGPGGYGYERVKDRYKEISPIHNITATAPPTIVFLGTQDELVPVATAEKYKHLMEQAGCRCELRLYEGAGHGFFNKGDYYEKTTLEMDRFLQSLGYLLGPATIARPDAMQQKQRS